ncbi:MAG: NYN domain-containing protein [Hyphomonas sp.]|nr:NYN domain-containing protein [Hyphomonas sp.]
MKTIAYVDGYNLYFRLLRKNRENRWLNIESLIRNALDDGVDITKINYYTARVKGQIDREAPGKQQRYLNALSSLPLIDVHFGRFSMHEKWAGLIQPPRFLPETEIPEPYPDVVKVRRAEEKGSDVNLATHLVRDAFKGAFEQAVVITNDTDLIEPIRVVVEEVGLPVGLLAPVEQPARTLKAVASWFLHLKPGDAAKCQFPDQVPFGRGKLALRPEDWCERGEE